MIVERLIGIPVIAFSAAMLLMGIFLPIACYENTGFNPISFIGFIIGFCIICESFYCFYIGIRIILGLENLL